MNDALAPLLTALSEGSLDVAGRAALGDLLRTDAAARDRYLDLMTTDALLRREFLSYQHRTEALPLRPTNPMPRRGGVRNWEFGMRSWIALAALIALALTAWFLLPTSSSTPHSELRTLNAVATSVATLTNIENVVFDGQSLQLGSTLQSGSLQLASGKAQIMFASDAVVDLAGPCQFEIIDKNRGRLISGTLEAYVPKQARGFTLDLPDGSKIVDLGTAFRVLFNQFGQPELSVTQGVVTWTASSDENVKPLLVRAGQSAVLREGRLELEAVASVKPVGMVIDDEGSQASRWRTYKVAKRFDADGDNRYGTDGYEMFAIVSDLPAYIERVTLGEDIRAVARVGYSLVDNSNATQVIRAGTLGRGRRDAAPGDIVDVVTYRVTDAAIVPHGFRIGVMTDGLEDVDFASASIQLALMRPGSMPVTFNVDPHRNRKIDMVFFDVTHVHAGDEFVIRAAKSLRKTATIQVITWDRLPDKPHQHATSDGSSQQSHSQEKLHD